MRISEGHSASSKDERKQWFRLQYFHWVGWSASLTFVLIRFSTSPILDKLAQTQRNAFRDGIYGSGSLQDIADTEWEFGREAIGKYWLFVLLQPLISQVFFSKRRQLLPHFYAFYSIFFVTWNFYWESILVHVVQFAVFYMAALSRSKTVCYMVMLLMVGQDQLLETELISPIYFRRGYFVYQATTRAMYWLSLRGLSFSVDFIRGAESKDRSFPSFWKSLGYFFYLPPMHLGPVMLYNDFVAQLEKPKLAWNVSEVLDCLKSLIRCFLHITFLNAVLHYFYSHALLHQPVLLAQLDSASLAGFAMSIHLLFYLKYVVFYGAPGAAAKLDRMTLPPPPKCVVQSHLCSHFWRHFDRGLHLWLRSYLHGPLVDGHGRLFRRLVATAAVFMFVSLWHKLTPAVNVWTAINFLCIVIEIGASSIGRHSHYQHFKRRYLAGYRLRVFYAALGSPFYLLSIFSCVIPLTSIEVGFLLLDRVVLGFPVPVVPVLIALYFASHLSMDVMEWEKKRLFK